MFIFHLILLLHVITSSSIYYFLNFQLIEILDRTKFREHAVAGRKTPFFMKLQVRIFSKKESVFDLQNA